MGRFRRWLQRRHEQRITCPAGGLHDWEEFAGVGPAGFEYGFECVKCHEERR